MSNITYVQPDGTARTIDVPVGTSIMQAALLEDIDGIVAECGGNAMCATCHVYVRADDPDELPLMRDDEDEMLQCTAAERTSASRLSCQIRVTARMDGLTVQIPDEQ